MRVPLISVLLVAIVLIELTNAEAVVDAGRIRVFLFASAAFYSEVAVDVRNDTCLSLDNNLIDGRVKSVLVGGHDVWEVMARDDDWYCLLYDNYGCIGAEDAILVIPGGANNLASSGWQTRVHGVRCVNTAG